MGHFTPWIKYRPSHSTLLTTKLAPPPLNFRTLPRDTLIDKIQQSIQGRLTLVMAPAGSGKTVLLSQWYAKYRTHNPVIGWMSLDRNDNDFGHFLAYIAATLSTIHHSFTEDIVPHFFACQTQSLECSLLPLVNACNAIAYDCVLVFDEYHLITSNTVQEAIYFLLQHLPAHIHCVIACRAVPSWSLSHFRTSCQLTELQATDLWFTSDEIQTFLRQTMQLPIPYKLISKLEFLTEGWIMGLSLIAYTLRECPYNGNYTQALVKSRHYVADYFAEEIFFDQPVSIQNFLLSTSIADSLSVSLCHTLTRQNSSLSILRALERSNIFIIPLDAEKRLYRYHHFFRDFLCEYLHLLHSEWLHRLHRRALKWSQQQKGDGEIDSKMIVDMSHHAFSSEVDSVTFIQSISILSERERQVLRYIVTGMPDQDIASHMVVTENTVKWHIRNIYSKLNIHNRTQLILKARELTAHTPL